MLILTTFDRDDYVYGALRAGARWLRPQGHLPRGPARRHPCGRRRRGPARAPHHPPAHRRVHPAARTNNAPRPALLDSLTGRETDVLRQVAKGLSNAEIARALHMSPGTAKTHVSRLLTKIGARDRAQLVVAAYESGLVPLCPPQGDNP